VVSSCWLYKANQFIVGSLEKHKAIFVACGFSQVEGIDYVETFSLVVRYSSIISIWHYQHRWVGRYIKWM